VHVNQQNNRETKRIVMGTELEIGAQPDNKHGRSDGRSSAKLWVVIGLAIIALAAAWLNYWPHGSAKAADGPPPALP
jgi:hypothetical protein